MPSRFVYKISLRNWHTGASMTFTWNSVVNTLTIGQSGFCQNRPTKRRKLKILVPASVRQLRENFGIFLKILITPLQPRKSLLENNFLSSMSITGCGNCLMYLCSCLDSLPNFFHSASISTSRRIGSNLP